MNKKLNLTFLTLLSSCCMLSASEEDDQKFDLLNANRVHLRPEIQTHKHVEKIGGFEVKSKGYLIGAKLEHEFLVPDYFYCSNDVKGSVGRVTSNAKNLYSGRVYTAVSKPFVFRAETREGYAFTIPYAKKTYAIPFGGIGINYSRTHYASDVQSQESIYVLVGGKVVHDYSKTLTLNAQAKVIYTPFAKEKYCGNSYTWHPNCVGFEFSAPVQWRPFFLSGWGVEVEPSWLTFDASKAPGKLGLKFKLAYNW